MHLCTERSFDEQCKRTLHVYICTTLIPLRTEYLSLVCRAIGPLLSLAVDLHKIFLALLVD